MEQKGQKRRLWRGQKRIRFGNYPYTATRVWVMKSLLATPADYLRMEKMGLYELIRFLEEGQYKQEIDALAGSYRGAELLELALNQNMAKTLNKLLRISQKQEVRLAIGRYANKWVVENLKAVLRCRFNRLGRQELAYALIPFAPTTLEACGRLLEADDEVVGRELERIAGVRQGEARKLLAERNLLALENAMDRAYFERLNAFSHAIRASKQDRLKEFLRLQVDVLNVKNILRLKAGGADAARIRAFLVLDPQAQPKVKRLWERMLRAKDVAEMRKAAKGTKVARLLGGADDLAGYENAIEKFLLAYSYRLMARKPLSAATIFGFLLNKELEVRNIRLLLHAKALGLGEGFIASNLVLPERRWEG